MTAMYQSRFWACFFAPSLFGLYWAYPMGKTRKWIVLNIPVYLFGLGTRVDFDEMVWLLLLVLHLLFVGILFRFMYGWVTRSNLNEFGYESKSDLEKALRARVHTSNTSYKGPLGRLGEDA